MLRYLTAGESHGRALVAIVEGVPAGLYLTREHLDRDLARRQSGYGRGRRMQIEQDRVEILSGVRFGSGCRHSWEYRRCPGRVTVIVHLFSGQPPKSPDTFMR